MRIKLFGGPENGREIEVPPHMVTLTLAILDPMPVEYLDSPADMAKVPYSKIVYAPKRITGLGRHYIVWAPAEWTVDLVVTEIMNRAGAQLAP